jgi:hypothetical protein
VTEPEFVLVEGATPATDVPEVRPLKRAGRRGVKQSVLIRVDGYPRRRRLLLLALVAVAIGAAAFVVVKRKRAANDADAAAWPREDDDELVAMREPPIVAVP